MQNTSTINRSTGEIVQDSPDGSAGRTEVAQRGRMYQPTIALDFAEVLAHLTSPEAIEAQKAMSTAYDKMCHALLGENDTQEEGGKTFKKKSAWRKLGRAFQVSTDIVHVEKGWAPDENGVSHYYAEVHVRGVAPWGQSTVAVAACSTRESRFFTMGPLCPRCGGTMWDNRGDKRGPEDFACRNKKSCGAVVMPGQWTEDDIGRIPNPVARMKAEHDCLGTAQTRAQNRAVSDLIAAGEVSAEEVDGAHLEDRDTGNGGQPSSASPQKAQPAANGSAASSNGSATNGSASTGAKKGSGATTTDVPNCPKCDGPMYDNRKKNVERAAENKKLIPEFKCKEKVCAEDGGLYWHGEWPPKDEADDGSAAELDRLAGSCTVIVREIGKLDADQGRQCQQLLDDLLCKDGVTAAQITKLGGQMATRLRKLEGKPDISPKPENLPTSVADDGDPGPSEPGDDGEDDRLPF